MIAHTVDYNKLTYAGSSTMSGSPSGRDSQSQVIHLLKQDTSLSNEQVTLGIEVFIQSVAAAEAYVCIERPGVCSAWIHHKIAEQQR